MRLARRIAAIAAVALLALVAGVWWWLPWNPLEAPAGPIDALLPADVEIAVRFDGGALRRSPFARRLWDHPTAVALREDLGVDALLDRVREAEGRLAAAAPGLLGDASAADDLLGGDIVIARRNDDVGVLARISPRARALELVRTLGDDTLAASGVRIEGDLVVVAGGDEAPEIFVARHRDVLVASTSSRFVQAVLAVAETGGAGLVTTPGYDGALRASRPAGERVLAWASPGALAALLPDARAAGDAGDADQPAGWRALLAPTLLGPLRAEADLSSPTEMRVRLHGSWDRHRPVALHDLLVDPATGAASLHEEASRWAVPGESMWAGGLEVRAASAIEALLASQPPEHTDAFQQALASAGETTESLAAALARHFADGLGVVVARLRETDGLDLDHPEGGGVFPIPATLVILRLRGDTTPDAFLADLERRGATLFGSSLGLDPRRAAGGAWVHAPISHPYGGEWALLRPALAFVDGLCVFSTNEAFLERALARREEAWPARAPAGRLAASLDLFAEPLRRHYDDQRWAFADRETCHDWAQERREIRAELDRTGSVLRPEDRMVYEDARIDERIERVRQTEFPAAIARWRRLLRPLDLLGDSTVRIAAEGRDVEIDLTIGLAR